MRWRKNGYVVHRWLGLLVSLQLLAWSVGGFAFSILHIEDVRGELDRTGTADAPLALRRVRLSPAEAVDRALNAGMQPGAVRTVTLEGRGGRIAYKLLGRDAEPLASVDAATGDAHLRISEAEARAAAVADFALEAEVASVVLLEGTPPLEFRGGRMPVYRVILDHPKRPHIYVCPVTAEVLKRRNKLWRIFDFFWMLHIMDYGQREDFNHWLLTGMSALAIATSLSGMVLWSWRLPRVIRKYVRTCMVRGVPAGR